MVWERIRDEAKSTMMVVVVGFQIELRSIWN